MRNLAVSLDEILLLERLLEDENTMDALIQIYQDHGQSTEFLYEDSQNLLDKLAKLQEKDDEEEG